MGAAQKEGDCGILQGGGERKRDRPKMCQSLKDMCLTRTSNNELISYSNTRM